MPVIPVYAFSVVDNQKRLNSGFYGLVRVGITPEMIFILTIRKIESVGWEIGRVEVKKDIRGRIISIYYDQGERAGICRLRLFLVECSAIT